MGMLEDDFTEAKRVGDREAEIGRLRPDKARIDWLAGRIVDTIYLDDGKIIDVRGENLRKAIDAAMARWPGPDES